MEENNRTEETVRVKEEYRPMCSNHPLMKALMTGLLTFLGAFCAFYVVADWHFKNSMHNPYADRMERIAERGFARKAANIIHLEQMGDVYKIIIDLRAFDNNENNVQVSSNGNILTINGRSIRKSKYNEQISEFQQNYMFGNNVKLNDLTKETNGNYYVITIPIDKEKSED